MHAKTVGDLGALVRSARMQRRMTQADLAHELRVSRDWVVRLEKGHPRAEAQKVLDALLVLGLTLDVTPAPRTEPHMTSATGTDSKDAARPAGSATAPGDPFETLFGKQA